MLVCHCNRVCDRTVRQCIREGARSVDQVALRCHAGSTCGGCLPLVEQLIRLEQREAAAEPELEATGT